MPVAVVVGVAALLVLLIVAGAAFVGFSRGVDADGSAQGNAGATPDWGALAARQLQTAPGLRYEGTMSADGRPVRVVLQVSRAGSASGAMTVGGLRALVVSVGDQTFVKAGPAFWRTYGGESSHPENYANRWSKAPATLFKMNVADVLGVTSIATLLGKTTARPAKETVGGTPVYRLRTQRADYFLAAAAPHQLLRVHPAGPGDPRFQATPLADTAALFTEMRPRVAALGGAGDPGLRFRPGTLTFVNCDDNVHGCTIRLPATMTSPDGAVPANARAQLRATITAEGRALGSCTGSGPVPANREMVLRCTVGGRVWSAWMGRARDIPGAHPYGATARVVGEAVDRAGVRDLLAKIDRER
ncbi:hypothetical protein [Spirillospora sp. NPDC047279]|uniref:hypothetical protein n=1 Tax=Spirillospora sp. NPDC047279 TaxID=3155478 RepID=UPI0033CA43AD